MSHLFINPFSRYLSVLGVWHNTRHYEYNGREKLTWILPYGQLSNRHKNQIVTQINTKLQTKRNVMHSMLRKLAGVVNLGISIRKVSL